MLANVELMRLLWKLLAMLELSCHNNRRKCDESICNGNYICLLFYGINYITEPKVPNDNTD